MGVILRCLIEGMGQCCTIVGFRVKGNFEVFGGMGQYCRTQEGGVILKCS